MAKRKTEDAILAETSENNDLAEAVTTLLTTPVVYPELGDAPPMWSLEWQDYCMGLFGSGEVNEKGHPYIRGLRRVATLVHGPIVSCDPTVVQAPSPENEFTAVVSYRVGFASRLLGRDIFFGGEADVSADNAEPAYARFPTALAGTRAKARAFCEALQLAKCGADELTSLPVVERTKSKTGTIEDYQVNGIKNHCKTMKINILAFINSGGSNYGCIEEMSKESAAKVLSILNKYHQKRDTIPKEILIDAA